MAFLDEEEIEFKRMLDKNGDEKYDSIENNMSQNFDDDVVFDLKVSKI